ncbi:hypothetical protein L1987_36963 [Smallanthus sonchifolius]|uniref:Uncharacterized protein n=1 Tax=Smallanthus sonchifolius TaxID=185202 RepID=A0ACB9HEM3_9ASTR|nr:hypothetical protein L1987_36963 [Smallanthus sonchifolius]
MSTMYASVTLNVKFCNSTEDLSDADVMYILPQPAAESKSCMLGLSLWKQSSYCIQQWRNYNVVIINEQIESRTTKLGIASPEPCVDFEIVSSCSEQNKHKEDCFLVVGKSGHVYLYDDFSIEKYLLQSQSRSPSSLPKEVKVRLQYSDSCITVANFITDNPCMVSSADEGVKKIPARIIPFEGNINKRPCAFSFKTEFLT